MQNNKEVERKQIISLFNDGLHPNMRERECVWNSHCDHHQDRVDI